MSREERADEIKQNGIASHFPRWGWDEPRMARYLCSQAEVGERETKRKTPSASLLGRGAEAVEKMLKLRGDYPAEEVKGNLKVVIERRIIGADTEPEK